MRFAEQSDLPTDLRRRQAFAMKIFFSGNSFGWILDQVLGHQHSEEDDHGNPDHDGPYRRQVRRSSAISTSRGSARAAKLSGVDVPTLEHEAMPQAEPNTVHVGP